MVFPCRPIARQTIIPASYLCIWFEGQKGYRRSSWQRFFSLVENEEKDVQCIRRNGEGRVSK